MQAIKKGLAFMIMRLFRLFPIKHNKLFIYSYYGSQYGCNPKYISEYIANHSANVEFDIVWAFNEPAKKTHIHNVRKVKIMSLRYFYELCTAKIVITNFRTTELYVKRKDQYYIQTWHSSLRLKQIEKDAENVLPANYVQMAKKDSLKCDLLLSGCKYSTAIFKRAYWYDGEIFEHGTPRNDLLMNNNAHRQKQIRKKLNLSSSAKVALYAPTFRKNNNMEVYNVDWSGVTAALKEQFGSEWTILVKLHPHLRAQSNQLTYGENVLDVSVYDDIQELLLTADVLITDYSSLMFDYSITKRPCFLYLPDAEAYTEQDRKLYFDLEELPFVKASSNNELAEKIKTFEPIAYEQELERFLKNIGSFENGNACVHLLERIYKVCYPSNKRSVADEAV